MRTWIAFLFLSACFIKPNPQSQSQGDGGPDGNGSDGSGSSGSDHLGSGSGSDLDEASGYDPTHNVMFVTSKPFTANAGTLTIQQANAFCGSVAAANPKLGQLSFQAWLSLPTDQVEPRFTNATGGWKRVDGRPFANSYSELKAGNIFHPPLIDENGSDVRPTYAGNPNVMTATTGKGLPQSPEACNGFAAATTTGPLYGGVAWATTEDWSRYQDPNGAAEELSCSNPKASIYCFEVRTLDGNVIPNRAGRKIWVSKGTTQLPIQPANADPICSNEQPGAVALLATAAFSPASRAKPGPYVRPDGAFVADDGHLDDLAAPINVQLDGTYVTGPIWVGSTGLTHIGDSTEICLNANAGQGMLAQWVQQGSDFTYPCSTQLPVICVDNN